MQKILSTIALAICTTLLAASCVDTIDPGPEEPSTAPESAPEHPAADGSIIRKSYFSGGVQVGECTTRTCPPKGTTCTGQKTTTFTTEIEACFAAAPAAP